MSGTIVPIAHNTLVPHDRWKSNEIVYYNPVVKQKRNDDGSIQFRVRGTAGGNLLTVPYDVSARIASLDTVKLLIHSVISGNYSWMTIDRGILKTPEGGPRKKSPEGIYTQSNAVDY
jgi:hypothetical protein